MHSSSYSPAYLWQRVQRRVRNSLLDVWQHRGWVAGPAYRLLLACSRGLHLYEAGRVTQLLPGNFFGLCPAAASGEFYAARYVQHGVQDERSNLYVTRFDGRKLRVLREISFTRQGIAQRPVRVHQVAWHAGALWVTNTRQNVVWKCSPEGQVLAEWTGTRRFDYHPDRVQDLTRAVRAAPEYQHYNSLAFHHDRVYVLAHNSAGTDKSRRSFLVTLNGALEEIDRREELGRACHDLFFLDDDLYICSSADGLLLQNFQPVLETDRFLRGLDAVGNMLIVGGTSVEPESRLRGQTNSQLLFVDRADHRLTHAFTLGRVGDIHEIVALDGRKHAACPA